MITLVTASEEVIDPKWKSKKVVLTMVFFQSWSFSGVIRRI